MCANGAELRSLGSYADVTAVAALPYLDLALGEDSGCLDILQQCSVALLVMLLDSTYHAELAGKSLETFGLGCLCEILVHVCPLEVLAVCGCLEVVGCLSDSLELLEPHLGMLFLILCCLEEDG